MKTIGNIQIEVQEKVDEKKNGEKTSNNNIIK